MTIVVSVPLNRFYSKYGGLATLDRVQKAFNLQFERLGLSKKGFNLSVDTRGVGIERHVVFTAERAIS